MTDFFSSARALFYSPINAILFLREGCTVANMLPYEPDQKAKLVKFYLETKSIILAQRKWKKFFKIRKAPSRKTILCLTEKFLATGSVENMKRGRCGAKRTKRTPAAVLKARQILTSDPKTPLRQLSQQLSCSYSTAQRMARADLSLRPYKISIHQQLRICDKEARKRYCAWFLRKCDASAQFNESIWFSDEAHFHLDGHVSTQNNRHWGTEPPKEVAEKPLHSKKCTAWCAISAQGVVGPIWLEDDNGQTATINAARYRKVLGRFWRSLCNRYRRAPDQLQVQWFQQDGAPPHRARETMSWLRDRFQDRLISKGAAIEWPAHSPDLTPPDYFLWGHLKAQVYRTGPKNLQDLKKAVEQAVRRITLATCRAVMEAARKRAELCLQENGGHLEHVL